MDMEKITDKYNVNKVWLIKRYKCGTYYFNQEIAGNVFNKAFIQVTKRYLKNIGIFA